jgi:hypothetical protein
MDTVWNVYLEKGFVLDGVLESNQRLELLESNQGLEVPERFLPSLMANGP